MDKEKLQRGNELAERITAVKSFLEVFRESSEHINNYQIKVMFNVPLNVNVVQRTILACFIPDAFKALISETMFELEALEKEFEEL